MNSGGCRLMFGAVVLSMVSGVGAAQDADFEFNGNWRGIVEVNASYGILDDPEVSQGMRAPREFNIRIRRNGDVSVRSRGLDRPWSQLGMPFALFEWGDSAVIVGRHRSDGWIEVVSFNLTRIDQETLLVYWWRVVNNLYVHPDDPGSKFAVGGFGKLSR